MAMLSVADQFGIGLAKAARMVLKKSGFELVYALLIVSGRSAGYGTDDDRGEAAQSGRLCRVQLHLPDTMAITEQARVSSFNPKVFYTAVGTAFPQYKQRFGSDVKGWMDHGLGECGRSRGQRLLQASRRRGDGQEPDRWAGPITYASLQMLQQAIERVGRIDRAAVIKELQTGTFQTIVGPIKLKDNMYPDTWYVGQWQNGEFYGLAPGEATWRSTG